ncbi:MAG: M20 family metallopeptidase [Pyramidobacter sp.]|uniref:M20 metallopeptidase family protein n=1 Tax=Pyramidobacter sp. TaxID=1943581 RepID=UPI002A833A73|nr:M20 family metallopeptidase [Pyramidobacter sp.]MDY4032698.1 M20 family metallopeptidase [Pyramidobacter sp.]
MSNVKEAIADITPEMIAIRTHIHEHPELSLKEFDTCALLEDYVKKNVKYDYLKRVGQTGLFFVLKGTKPGPGKTIVFRGDIDALPIQEDESMSPCSTVPGVMHACGHDIHGTINVGAAAILSRIKDQFSGSIFFFIQPVEETLAGAQLFLTDPAIPWNQIDAVAALHVSAELEVGKIGVRYGAILASADEFTITVCGKGGHGAHCHTVRDPIVAGAAMVSSLQTLVSRETNPANAVVVSITQFHAGCANNIIPDKAILSGTVRTLNSEDRSRTEASIKRMASCVAEGFRCTADVQYDHGVPPFICEDEWVDRALRVGRKILGTDNTCIMPYAAMGGEDFAFIKEHKPGIFVRLGCRTPGGAYGSAHSSTFYADPDCIPVGIYVIIGLAADYLGFEVK